MAEMYLGDELFFFYCYGDNHAVSSESTYQ